MHYEERESSMQHELFESRFGLSGKASRKKGLGSIPLRLSLFFKNGCGL